MPDVLQYWPIATIVFCFGLTGVICGFASQTWDAVFRRRVIWESHRVVLAGLLMFGSFAVIQGFLWVFTIFTPHA